MKPLFLGYDALKRQVRLMPDQRKIHMHVIGSSGSGKSKLLEWMMRGDLRNRQGFCLIDPHGTLYDDLVAYCAHHVLDREVIQLNLSTPDAIVGFNPFTRTKDGDVSVQVDRRIAATMRAWNVEDTDQTPTLARTLRLIYTVMLELNLGLPQVAHLIDFNASEIRGRMIEQLSSPLIQREWRELQGMKAKEWREETLSARNRLFKFLTSTTLARFMGVPDSTLNLQQIMNEGKVLLVNLAPSDHLSHDNAKAFGALLVNEFYECALRRKRDPATGRSPAPYYLYIDEFQNFVTLDIDDMLDQVRKFGLYLCLAHQRFGQMDENIADAVLTNCQIKAVFGGLSTPDARRMAEEVFIGKLDPKKVKVALYQTKFWPEYRRDKVYSKGSAHATASGSSESSAAGSFSGLASGTASFQPDQWFPQSPGMTMSDSTSSGSSSMSGSSSSDSESWGESEGEADIPIFFPVPFEELSSVQYFSLEEQLTEATVALKQQFQRHCFIKLPEEETQPLLVPFVKSFYTPAENVQWYVDQHFKKQHARSIPEVDRLLIEQDASLLQTIRVKEEAEEIVQEDSPPEVGRPEPEPKLRKPIWDRNGESSIWKSVAAVRSSPEKKTERKRGPRPDTENHAKVTALIRRYQDDWVLDDNLSDICEMLDQQGVPIPKTWPTRNPPSRSWTRAFANYPALVVKAIKDRLKAAEPSSSTQP
jgi:hypothetical protein